MLYSYNVDTVSTLYRYCIGTVSILYRYCIDMNRYCIDTVSIQYRYCIGTVSIQYRYHIDIISISHRPILLSKVKSYKVTKCKVEGGLGSVWGRFGVGLRSVWGGFGEVLRMLWGDSRGDLGASGGENGVNKKIYSRWRRWPGARSGTITAQGAAATSGKCSSDSWKLYK